MTTDYDPAFYELIAPGCRASAAVVVPLLVDRLAPRTVVDVGCGQGWWGHEFTRFGCDVVGLDGGYVPDRQVPFVETDLTERIEIITRFDMAVCLEVAEHLPLERAPGFVDDLCALSDRVVFSAAIPWQTGAGHVNLQWPSWWAALFAEWGYGCDGTLRFELWDDDRVEPWYRQNLLVFERGVMRDSPFAVPLDVVHPAIHAWGRA